VCVLEPWAQSLRDGLSVNLLASMPVQIELFRPQRVIWLTFSPSVTLLSPFESTL
jgi:hypothetical protein